MKKRIQLQGTFIIAGIVAAILLRRWLFTIPASSLSLGEIIRYAFCIGAVMVGFLLRISARGVKAAGNPDGKTLITAGPYTLCRNPMYLGTLLIGLGLSCALFQWWMALVFLCVYTGIYIPQMKKEEQLLQERFGAVYKQYCDQTPLLVPPPCLCSLPLGCCVMRLRWVRKELPSLLLVLAGMLMFDLWREQEALGHIKGMAQVLKWAGGFVGVGVFVLLFVRKDHDTSAKN